MDIYKEMVKKPFIGYGFEKDHKKPFILAFAGNNNYLSHKQWMELADSFLQLSNNMKNYAKEKIGEI